MPCWYEVFRSLCGKISTFPRGRLFSSNQIQPELLSVAAYVYAQQTTIKLVLTLAIYHAQNVTVMDEILGELDKAKGVHTRTASHIEFLYDQVQMIRDTHRPKNKQLAGRLAMLAAGFLVAVSVMTYLFWNQFL